jgi:hypothetical protein
MSCTFTKIRLLRESPIELSFVECLNLECIAQLSYIRGLHSMAHIATLPCHIKTQLSSPSLHNARIRKVKNQGKPKLTKNVNFHVRCKVPIIHLIIYIKNFFVVVIVTTWLYTFFQLHLKWALLHSGIQGLRALSLNVHEPSKKNMLLDL